MKRDKRKVIIGIIFLLFTVLCIMKWATIGYRTYLLTGAVLFTIVGTGFLRSSKIG